jgi:hypothetical protein
MVPDSQRYAQGAGNAPFPRDIAAALKTKNATGTVKLSLHCHRSYDQEICSRNQHRMVAIRIPNKPSACRLHLQIVRLAVDYFRQLCTQNPIQCKMTHFAAACKYPFVDTSAARRRHETRHVPTNAGGKRFVPLNSKDSQPHRLGLQPLFLLGAGVGTQWAMQSCKYLHRYDKDTAYVVYSIIYRTQ